MGKTMKLNKAIKNLVSKKDSYLIQKDLQNKDKSLNIENQKLNNDLSLLGKEYKKRYDELKIFYRTEYQKIMVRHNHKTNQINLQ